MNRKKESKKLPCKKHSRKISADVKKIYQNVMKDKLDFGDDKNFDMKFKKCIK